MRHSICGLVFCWATSSSKSHHFQICVLSVSYRIPFELVIDLEHKFAARSDWLMNFHISICLLELILSDLTAPFKASYYCWNERLKIALPSRRVSNDVHFRKTRIWSKLTLIFSVLMWHFVFMRSQHWSAKVHLMFNTELHQPLWWEIETYERCILNMLTSEQCSTIVCLFVWLMYINASNLLILLLIWSSSSYRILVLLLPIAPVRVHVCRAFLGL